MMLAMLAQATNAPGFNNRPSNAAMDFGIVLVVIVLFMFLATIWMGPRCFVWI